MGSSRSISILREYSRCKTTKDKQRIREKNIEKERENVEDINEEHDLYFISSSIILLCAHPL
jgi:hypothetical protein